jgi:hypothetical protein
MPPPTTAASYAFVCKECLWPTRANANGGRTPLSARLGTHDSLISAIRERENENEDKRGAWLKEVWRGAGTPSGERPRKAADGRR